MRFLKRLATQCVYYVLLPLFAAWYLVRPPRRPTPALTPEAPPPLALVIGEVLQTPEGPMRVLGVDENGIVWLARALAPQLQHLTNLAIFFTDGATASANRTGVVLVNESSN